MKSATAILEDSLSDGIFSGVRKEAVVKAPIASVWRAWSSSEGAREFFAPQANIELVVGEPYEICFDPADERQGAKGLKLLSCVPLERMSLSSYPQLYPGVIL